ncbi:Phage integrase family protein [compost metagenome]
MDWIGSAGLVRGPLFRSIDRWGNLGEEGLHANSIIPLLRQALSRAGVPGELYSSHSLRRGFATWASANGWDLKALMNYVGWKDMKSAMRYIDTAASFAGLALQDAAALPLTAIGRDGHAGSPDSRQPQRQA